MAQYCQRCGAGLDQNAHFCSACGATTVGGYQPFVRRAPLMRPLQGRIVAGVCQGIANQYGWEVAWVRVLAVVLTVFVGGLGAVAYVVLWVVLPEEPLALPGSVYPPPGYPGS